MYSKLILNSHRFVQIRGQLLTPLLENTQQSQQTTTRAAPRPSVNTTHQEFTQLVSTVLWVSCVLQSSFPPPLQSTNHVFIAAIFVRIPEVVRLAKIGSISVMSEPKCTETNLKKSQICPLSCQSCGSWANIWEPCVSNSFSCKTGSYWLLIDYTCASDLNIWIFRCQNVSYHRLAI